MESEALMKLLTGLFGYVLLMLGVILAIHFDFTIGLLISASGFFMFWGMLPQYDERGRHDF
jgi:ABC-type bacteriocin/lantibiotic exporter with double-glycine peptidase domain